MDILVEVEDCFLSERGLKKGNMHLVSDAEARRQLAEITDRNVRTLPGGSSANTARGVSALGGTSAFFGSIGTSIYGEMYQSALESAGVRTYLHKGLNLTGNAITYITEDHERTFSVHLGAAADVPWSVMDTKILASAKIIHLEGFQFEGKTKETLLQVVKFAKQHNVPVSLDLNDPALIGRNHDLFKEIAREYVNILFANETEGQAFTGHEDSLAVINSLREVADVVILKCGSDGAHIMFDGEITTIAAESVPVVDTTGAGDLFAAGFLYGLTHGYTAAESGSLGARAAAAIIGQIGVDTAVIEGIIPIDV